MLKEKAKLLYKLNKDIEKEFFALLKLDPESRFDFFLRLGYYYLKNNDFEKSVAVLTRALG